MPGEFKKTEFVGDKVVTTYTVDDSHQGWRADNYLRFLYRYKSRNQLQKAIEAGSIDVPGRRLKPATILQMGDQIRVVTPKRTHEPTVDLDYKVLYEDEFLMVVDKPGNLPVHPAGRFLFNTLVMSLRARQPECVDAARDRDFYLIHRLDRETSGAIVIAKQKAVATDIINQFFERGIEKRYYAVVRGIPEKDTFTIDADIGPARDSEVRLKMAPYEQGRGEQEPESGIQTALTHFTVLERGAKNALLDCKLETGRQHQIRVHAAHAGFPIVGDKLYGGKDDLFLLYNTTGAMTPEMIEEFGAERHALHSRYLRFYHKPLERWLEVESPLPEELRKLI